MNEYIFLMFGDGADATMADDGALWDAYITRLQASGQFDGGSAIGAGLRCSKGSGAQPAPPPSAVLAFHSEVVIERAEARTITRFDGDRWQQIREELVSDLGAAPPDSSGLYVRIDRIALHR